MLCSAWLRSALAAATCALKRLRTNKGTVTFTIELPMEQGELVDKALDKARDDSAAPEFADESWSARQADALVEMAKGFLNGTTSDDEQSRSADNYLVTVHVDQSALADGEGRSALPIESVKRIACDSDKVVIKPTVGANAADTSRARVKAPASSVFDHPSCRSHSGSRAGKE